MPRKRLFFDIETSPNIGMFWSAGFKQRIDYENIIKERAIICICYKWGGEREVSYLTWDKKQNDKKMLQEFIKVANEADELIGHNGDKFDLAWIRTRCLFHNIPMFPDYVTIDTLKVSRAKFRFNSNRLNYIGKFLGVGQKIHTSYDLWKDIVLKNCTKSLDKMVKYCKQDVKLLEEVFERMSVHIKPKVHYGMAHGSSKHDCINCGSDDMRVIKTRFTAAGTEKKQYQCNTCNKYSTYTATTANTCKTSNKKKKG